VAGKTNDIIGVLALQGAWQKHIELLQTLQVAARPVRQPEELKSCTGLIIPGGESTTISLLIQEYDLFEPIRDFAKNHPVMGVCAGLVMMASEVDDERIKPLELIPFSAIRNHYGRQIQSFSSNVALKFDPEKKTFPAIFIRAPGINNISTGVKVLAQYQQRAIMIEKGQHLALSFHPELTNDTRIHAYWLQKIHQCP
jgi:pyridoxal 5'-phosphate synthase pdxT subunit